MQPIHWFSLAAFLLALVLFFAGLATAGTAVLVVAFVVELVHAIFTGKQSNDGMR